MSLSAAQTALDHAWHLVRKGEVNDARFWASEASTLDPGLEEAWLILAAVSDPHDSFEYLKRALEINPFSRRGNRGVIWAEDKTGWSFTQYVSGFQDYSTYKKSPVSQETVSRDVQPPVQDNILESPTNWLNEPEDNPSPVESPSPKVQEAPEPPSAPEMIIRRKRHRHPKPVPENPWSVLLPYTVSFVIFLVMATLWLLSGLPSVKGFSDEPEYTTDELVRQILAENPTPTITITPSPTPKPTHTPTTLPTLTPTFTPVPSSTLLPTVENAPDDNPPIIDEDGDGTIPVFLGERVAYTLDDGRWIEVDLDKQMVRAFAGDILIREFLVSTGTAAHPTLIGDFHIYIKNRYADMRGPGYNLPNVPYTMYYYHSYGLHGTYWHDNFGTPMSHGCVNLRTEDAGWLFNWASIGTLVHVH